MKCLSCGVVELIYDICDVLYVYKGEVIVIFFVMGDFCLVCDEIVFECGEGD